MATFTEYVSLVDESQRVQSFAPGDEVPSWASEMVGDHVYEGTMTKRRTAAATKKADEPETQAEKA